MNENKGKSSTNVADVLKWMQAKLQQHGGVTGVSLPILAFLPALVTWLLVQAFAVNVPYYDDWERGGLLEKYYEARLSFQDLNAPHIDHRMFFPRVLILLLNELSGGDLRWEMYCSFGFVVLAGIGLCVLARATVLAGKMNWGVVFAINLVVFSPMQWDNFLWAVQIAFMLPMTCLIWALVVAIRPWVWWKRLSLCLALAIAATHSFGHGFVVWPAVFCLALLRRDFAMSGKQRLGFLVSWLVAGGLVIGCYLLVDFNNTSHPSHSYGQAVGAPPPSAVHAQELSSNLPVAAEYMRVLAGNVFSRMHLVDPLKLASTVGFWILMVFFVMVAWVLWQGLRKRGAWDLALPWLALGCSSLLGMAAVTIGRSNLIGVSRATSSRYNSISLYLTVALIFLLVLWIRQTRFYARWTEISKVRLGVMLMGLFAGYSFTLWNYGGQMMKLCHDARLQAKAALQFIHFWKPDQISRLDGDVKFLRQMAGILERYELLDPPLRTHLALDQYKVFAEPRSQGRARLLGFSPLKDGGFVLNGFAQIDTRPADGVLLTWESKGGKPEIFAMAEPTSAMVPQLYPGELEMAGRERPGIWDFCQWKKPFALADLKGFDDPGVTEVSLKCWVFDVKKLHANRIRGEIKIRRDGSFETIDF